MAEGLSCDGYGNDNGGGNWQESTVMAVATEAKIHGGGSNNGDCGW